MDVERIRFLLEPDGVFFARLLIAHDDARQPIFTFEPDRIVLVEPTGDDEAAAAMPDLVLPIGAYRINQRRAYDFEILGAISIGAHVNPITPIAASVPKPRLAGPAQ